MSSKDFSPGHREAIYARSSLTGLAEYLSSTNHALNLYIAGNALVSAPLVGQSKIAITGTAVQLNGGVSQALTNGLIISAPSTNAAAISVGTATVNNTQDGTGNGYLLAPGGSISFAVDNTTRMYINGTAGDIVSWAGS